MDSLLVLVGMAVVVFASTNLDDLFILLGLFADPKLRARDVVIGQYMGIGVLYGISVAASLLSLVIPETYIGLVGLLPISIGVAKLSQVVHESKKTKEEQERQPRIRATGGFLSIVAVTIANGGDNIGIYTPLFATRSGLEIAAIGLVFATMTGVWCLGARWMVEHRSFGEPIRLYGHCIVPFVLISLGVLIMYEADSAALLRHSALPAGSSLTDSEQLGYPLWARMRTLPRMNLLH